MNNISHAIEMYLGRKFTDEDCLIIDDLTEVRIENWDVYGVDKPTMEELETIWDNEGLTFIQSQKKKEIKIEAYRRITTAALDGDIGLFKNLPEWKQRNLITRASEIVKKKVFDGSITQDEQDELDSLQVLWDEVKGIRSKSNDIEAYIDSLSDEESVVNFDTKYTTRWL